MSVALSHTGNVICLGFLIPNFEIVSNHIFYIYRI